MLVRLTTLRRLPKRPAGALGRAFVRWIDFLIRRRFGMEEFNDEDDCVLRISRGRATEDLTLSDGTQIRRGEPVGELHLWNTRIPAIGAAGPDLSWGVNYYTRFVSSLRALSEHADGDPRFEHVRAFRGEMAFAQPDVKSGLRRIAQAAGFDFVRVTYSAGRCGQLLERWENFRSWLLIWTFNPGSLRGKKLSQLRRYQLWISRPRLRERYATCERKPCRVHERAS